MEAASRQYQNYLQILKEELIPATGCTEPISIAYGAAYVRDLLGCIPDKLEIQASGNLIKNVKSVVVPNTGGLRGIPAAAAAGIAAGKTDRLLEVISQVRPEQIEDIHRYLESHEIAVTLKETPLTFDFLITAYHGGDAARVRIANFHTNVVLAELNGKAIIKRAAADGQKTELTDRTCLNLKDILDFAETAAVKDLDSLFSRQIAYNTAISQEGLANGYGARVGRTLMSSMAGDPVETLLKASAAAGSDARMNGCEMPVVILSGSGNQGITASVPVIVYAREAHLEQEQLLRGLAVSNLITIHQKTSIGRLSAFCGAVSAGAGAAAGICYLSGGSHDQIAQTIINALAISSGIVCDGAKSSCAAKIALSLESGLIGFHMAMQGVGFCGGDGIVGSDVEQTISNVGALGHDGMRETDREILRIMTCQ